MFEPRHKPLLPRREFYARQALSFAVGTLVIAVALLVGMLGYHHFESMNWIDAFANAAMILSGMGPFGELHTEGGKLFAGIYALFSGLAFIAVVGIVFAPAIHRAMHRFHLEDQELDQRGDSAPGKPKS